MKSHKRIEWLHSVPGLIAIALGLIYGTGAITIYGQLKGAGLNGIEAMGSVPLDQILSRGIGGMASAFGQVLVYALYIGFIALFIYPWGTRDAPPPEPANAKEQSGIVARIDRFIGSGRVFVAIISLTSVGLLISSPRKQAYAYAVTIALVAAAVLYVLTVTRERDESGLRRLVAIYSTAYLTYLIVYTVSTAFLNPAPLPHVRLASRRATIEGGLVAESSGSWYVVQGNRSVLAVSTRKVQRVYITYPKRPPEQSLVDWVLDRPPPN